MFPQLNPRRNLHVASVCVFGDCQREKSLVSFQNEEATFNKPRISLVRLVDSPFLLNGVSLAQLDFKNSIVFGTRLSIKCSYHLEHVRMVEY